MTSRVLCVNRNQLALSAHNKRKGRITITDSYGDSVSLLLPFDDFQDISRSPKTITANGGAAISSARTVFNYTHSAYFNGTNSYISVAHHTDLSFGTISAATNFSVEFWIYPTGTMGSSVIYFLMCKGMPGSGGSGKPGWGVTITDGKIVLMVGGATPTAAYVQASSRLLANVWTHVGILCAAGAPYIYYNGVPQSYTYTYGTTMLNSVTDNTNYALDFGCNQIDSGNPARGSWFVGYLYGIRITKGVARLFAYNTPLRPFPDPSVGR